MNSKLFFIGFILSVAGFSCKTEVTDPVSPFSIQTNLEAGANQIRRSFALPNNTFLIFTHDRTLSFTSIYQFSSDLKLIKKKVISGHTYTAPVLDADQNLIMIGEYYEMNAGAIAVKLNQNLDVLETRDIQFLFDPSSVDIVYHPYLTRLSNGTFVVANSYEQYPEDRIVMFAVKDFFRDNDVLWRVNPTNYTKEWADGLYPDRFGNFYVTATEHINGTRNIVLKYNANGKLLHRNDGFVQYHNNFHLLVEDNHVLYKDFNTIQKLDTQLKKISEVVTDYSLKSELIKSNGHYFYTSELFNSDGLFMELIKTDEAFNPVKRRSYGNRGTNVGSDVPRFLLQLSSGEMVAIEMVENPDLTGNYWLLQKFDTELNLDE